MAAAAAAAAAAMELDDVAGDGGPRGCGEPRSTTRSICATPLLPKGTIHHIGGYMNNTETNPNVPDPRNWQGSGNRSVTNMFIDLGMRVKMDEEQFFEEMANRRQALNLQPNDHVIGCPLCAAPLVAPVLESVTSSD